MTRDTSNSADILDIRDIIERFEELEDERDGNDEHDDQCGQSGNWAQDNPDDAEELKTLESLLDELAGSGGDHQWKGAWYPVTLIRDSYFVEAMQELCEDIGDMPRDGFPSYMVIDWDATADNLRADYSSIEFDGVTYWYR